MNISKLIVFVSAAAVSLATAMVTLAVADVSKDAPSASPGELQLPPGWTMEDMQACIVAGTPNENHERLANDVGEWRGTTTMWMVPDAEPMTSECTATITPILDGRFTKCEWKGDMPGMGPYHGFGLYGFDNVTQRFVSTWIDNHNTGIMKGEGALSDDGKTLTWEFKHSCPITKKQAVMREIETVTGPNTKMLEMYGTDPKSGKEYKMMSIELTKQ